MGEPGRDVDPEFWANYEATRERWQRYLGEIEAEGVASRGELFMGGRGSAAELTEEAFFDACRQMLDTPPLLNAKVVPPWVLAPVADWSHEQVLTSLADYERIYGETRAAIHDADLQEYRKLALTISEAPWWRLMLEPVAFGVGGALATCLLYLVLQPRSVWAWMAIAAVVSVGGDVAIRLRRRRR